MTKAFFFLFILALLFSNSRLLAQDSINKKTEKEYKYAIGAGAGFCTGYGLSFRYHPNRFGGQINFGPYTDKETDRYSIGLTLLYTLIESKISNLYLYQGNHYYYNSQTNYIYNPGSPDPDKKRSTESYINNGLGFGIELILAKRIGFHLMAGYAFYSNFEKVNLTGETALYYKF